MAPHDTTLAEATPAVRAAQATDGGLLINIDNGGTLTDICVIDGAKTHRTKTLTTPYDLSKCLFDGLVKASRVLYGEDDVQRLLLATDYIRYSTTQGTNALVERKGPRLGLILGEGLALAALKTDKAATDLLEALVGPRVVSLDDAADEIAITRAVTQLTSAGANRLVVAFGGGGGGAGEAQIKKVLLRRFPQHLLGAVPILYSHEVVEDDDDARRGWTALFNAFLHPAMERFLYNAEHKLRAYKTKNPLLIFRNDGHSARVAKTIAVKTYSSGPRGGAEGAKALAAHYGFKRLLSMDVGGTTTDIGVVEDGVVATHTRGHIEGVASSIALSNVVSVGVGGSSIIRVENMKIAVGPESVGGAPGPACFGLGGKEATITDAFLVLGLLDPATYFGGELKIDLARARAAIEEKIAKPLGIDVVEAARQMEAAWVAKIAAALKGFTAVGPDTTLAAFGGAGPMVACRIAAAAGIGRVVIPGLAAVFSAFGIGFSDIAHQYPLALASADAAGLATARELLLLRARHGMAAEGAPIEQCLLSWTLQVGGKDEQSLAFDGEALPEDLPKDAPLSLTLQALRPIAHAKLHGKFGGAGQPAKQGGRRRLADGEVPVYRVEDQAAGTAAEGPAVLEEAFFTARLDAGWRFEINEAGDILLSHS